MQVYPWQISWQISPWLIIIVLIIIVLLTIFIVNRSILAHRRHISAGREDLIGRTAIVETTLNPKGTVFIEGEIWTATSESGNVEPEEEVVVTRVNGLKLFVNQVNKEE